MIKTVPLLSAIISLIPSGIHSVVLRRNDFSLNERLRSNKDLSVQRSNKDLSVQRSNRNFSLNERLASNTIDSMSSDSSDVSCESDVVQYLNSLKRKYKTMKVSDRIPSNEHSKQSDRIPSNDSFKHSDRIPSNEHSRQSDPIKVLYNNSDDYKKYSQDAIIQTNRKQAAKKSFIPSENKNDSSVTGNETILKLNNTIYKPQVPLIKYLRAGPKEKLLKHYKSTFKIPSPEIIPNRPISSPLKNKKPITVADMPIDKKRPTKPTSFSMDESRNQRDEPRIMPTKPASFQRDEPRIMPTVRLTPSGQNQRRSETLDKPVVSPRLPVNIQERSKIQDSSFIKQGPVNRKNIASSALRHQETSTPAKVSQVNKPTLNKNNKPTVPLNEMLRTPSIKVSKTLPKTSNPTNISNAKKAVLKKENIDDFDTEEFSSHF